MKNVFLSNGFILIFQLFLELIWMLSSILLCTCTMDLQRVALSFRNISGGSDTWPSYNWYIKQFKCIFFCESKSSYIRGHWLISKQFPVTWFKGSQTDSFIHHWLIVKILCQNNPTTDPNNPTSSNAHLPLFLHGNGVVINSYINQYVKHVCCL